MSSESNDQMQLHKIQKENFWEMSLTMTKEIQS